jgi:hypothetical protein
VGPKLKPAAQEGDETVRLELADVRPPKAAVMARSPARPPPARAVSSTCLEGRNGTSNGPISRTFKLMLAVDLTLTFAHVLKAHLVSLEPPRGLPGSTPSASVSTSAGVFPRAPWRMR